MGLTHYSHILLYNQQSQNKKNLFRSLKATKFFQQTELDWVEAGIQVTIYHMYIYLFFISLCTCLSEMTPSVRV